LQEESQGRLYDSALMRRLFARLRPYRRALILTVAVLLANAAVQVAGPLLTRYAIDRYIAPAANPAPSLDFVFSSDPRSGLAQVALVYLLAVAAGLFLEYWQQYLMTRTGQLAMFGLRRDALAHLQRLDIAYYDRNPVGRLVTRVTSDVDVLNEMFSTGIVTLIGDLFTLTFVTIAMFRLDAGMTFMLLGVMPFVFAATMRFRAAVAESNRRIRTAVARINSHLQENVTGVPVLQLFNREEQSAREFAAINRSHMDAFKDSITAYGWFYPVVEFLGMFALALLLAYGGLRVRSGELTLGVLVAFLQYGMRFFGPIQDLSEKYNILQSAMAAAERVFALLDEPVGVRPPANPTPVPARGGLAFQDVWFAYKGEDWVLRGVSFHVDPGETVAVVGHTGAGKTTLASLAQRFYDVQRGAVLYGGVDVREFDMRELRRRFGVVPQDPHLFTGTLRENLELGRPASEAAIQAAVERVNLAPFVQSLPGGLAYEVRERGAGLSTGQKQLVAFARALARDPEFLILDEATSSVDTETEMKIRDALDHLVEGRTSIIIAHRLSTIQRADRILVMHRGQVRETGTHQELLAARGLYWKLYQLQYKDQERASIQ